MFNVFRKYIVQNDGKKNFVDEKNDIGADREPFSFIVSFKDCFY